MVLTPVTLLIALMCAAVTMPAAQAATNATPATPAHSIHLMPTRQTAAHTHYNVKVHPNVSGSGDLQWNGGPVQNNPHTYAIFWGSSWKNSSGALNTTGNIVNNYFRDMGGTSFENILTQYYGPSAYINNTHNYGGYWIDTAAPAYDYSCGGKTIEDSAIQSEVNRAISARGWSRDSANGTYYVYTPNGYYVNDGSGSCSMQQFCAYHGWSSNDGVSYAAMAYPISLSACGVPSYPNGNGAGDSLASVTSHEQFESITDFQVNVNTAWVDYSGYEIGDKCAWDFSYGYTHLHNSGTFEIQTEYSNATSSCVNSY